MLKLDSSRKARFKSALARTGMTQDEWLAKEKIAYLHLYYAVLHDETDKVIEKVDGFIEQVESAA